MTRESTRALTSAIASGDTEAFARFYDLWFDRLLEQSQRMTQRDEATCMDVVQEVMMRVIRHLPTLDHEAALASWLRTTTRHCALDMLRAEQRQRTRNRASAAGNDEIFDEEFDDRIAWLRKMIDDLPPEERNLLMMRHRFRWTLGRIGAVLGIGPGSVDRRLRRILGKLRQDARPDVEDQCNA